MPPIQRAFLNKSNIAARRDRYEHDLEFERRVAPERDKIRKQALAEMENEE